MEEKHNNTNHRIIINDRERVAITGVSDVISFDTDIIIIETEMGTLTIKGLDLHVNRLNLEKEELDLDGQIEGIEYSDGSAYRTKGFMSKLFG
ncbi:MAG: sporulation protein YabP [Vallitalea sp.]|nr:sporulation protein YabP [Vallitalea sp.]